jgi:putative DNA primase/helicase
VGPSALDVAGDGSEYRRVLLDRGLYVAPGRKARDLLTTYLASCRTDSWARAVSRVGWHDNVFIFPDTTIGDAGGERVLLQTAAFLDHAFRVRGTLTDWCTHIANHCAGNSRLAFAVSASLPAPLLHLTGGESGCFHLVGPSSIEAVAVAHCDVLLCLDELSQIDAKSAGHAAYMLANGGGKARAGRSGDGRPPAEWRCLFLSTGEIGIADKVAEDSRRRVTAGQRVRVIDIPCRCCRRPGVVRTPSWLRIRPSPGGSSAAGGDGILWTLAPEWFIAANIDTVSADLRIARDAFCQSHVPEDADGQVARVAARFGLIAAAGELPIAADILPWTEGEAERSAFACLRAWLGSWRYRQVRTPRRHRRRAAVH